MIGGNITAEIQIKSTIKNEIGASEATWVKIQEIDGWLDMVSADVSYQTYDTKVPESTHVFVADYIPLDSRVKKENSRLVINDRTYDIKDIDDPMDIHAQLEIYLKYTGGMDNGK